jgi:apoptotic chromatin condensation inducer in the nucleus
VPPPAGEPTNTLLVCNFVRPFTLKAVKDLLAETGTVTNFWMNDIKTHCYVSVPHQPHQPQSFFLTHGVS